MDAKEAFDSELRSSGDLAGVYEFDGEVSCFYLFAPDAAEGSRILGAIRIVSGAQNQPAANELSIRWDDREEYVGLFLRGRLWAVFDANTRAAYAEAETTPTASRIPAEIKKRFSWS